MKTFEILSWKKNTSECGVRIQPINEPEIFLYDSGIQFKVVSESANLKIKIIEWSKETKWDSVAQKSEYIGLSKDHAQKGFITGTAYQIKQIMGSLGYATIESPVCFRDNLIESLKDEMEYLKSAINSLTDAIEKLNTKEVSFKQRLNHIQ